MEKTPQQIANLHPQAPERQQWLFDPATPLADLHQFINIIAWMGYGSHSGTIFELTKTAIDVRIAQDAANASEKLTGQTDRLVGKIADLVLIAEEQKKLAIKLERQTKTLIRLSWALVVFSVVLLAVALVQTKIMFKENPQANVQHVHARQNN